MANAWYKAIASANLPSRGLVKVHFTGQPVLLARLEDGTLAASSAVCPHEAEDLSEGTIYMGAIDCPRHHYLYDLPTGENRYPRNVFPTDLARDLAALTVYPVKEKDGWIWIALEDD